MESQGLATENIGLPVAYEWYLLKCGRHTHLDEGQRTEGAVNPHEFSPTSTTTRAKLGVASTRCQVVTSRSFACVTFPVRIHISGTGVSLVGDSGEIAGVIHPLFLQSPDKHPCHQQEAQDKRGNIDYENSQYGTLLGNVPETQHK